MVRERLTLTVEEAVQLLGISRGLAYELVRRGELPSVHLGRRIVVPVRRLEAMLGGDGAGDDGARVPSGSGASGRGSGPETPGPLGGDARSA